MEIGYADIANAYQQLVDLPMISYSSWVPRGVNHIRKEMNMQLLPEEYSEPHL